MPKNQLYIFIDGKTIRQYGTNIYEMDGEANSKQKLSLTNWLKYEYGEPPSPWSLQPKNEVEMIRETTEDMRREVWELSGEGVADPESPPPGGGGLRGGLRPPDDFVPSVEQLKDKEMEELVKRPVDGGRDYTYILKTPIEMIKYYNIKQVPDNRPTRVGYTTFRRI